MNPAALGLGIALSLLVTVLPTLAWCALIWWCDRFEREPIPLVIAAFLWGALPAVGLALLAESAFTGGSAGLTGEIVDGSAVAPLAEEFAKAGMLLLLLLFWHGEIDDMLDGLLYGALIGFGFGMTENLLYALGALSAGGWTVWATVILLRNVVFGLNHAFFTAFTGAALGYARMARTGWGRYGVPLAGLTLAVLVHAIHNLGASLAGANVVGLLLSLANDGSGVIIIVVLFVIAIRQERHWVRVELADEVGGLLTAGEYTSLLSLGGRWSMLTRAGRAQGFTGFTAAGKFQQAATELAFRKHRLRVRGVDAAAQNDITRLAARLRSQRAQLNWAGPSEAGVT